MGNKQIPLLIRNANVFIHGFLRSAHFDKTSSRVDLCSTVACPKCLQIEQTWGACSLTENPAGTNVKLCLRPWQDYIRHKYLSCYATD